MRSRRTVVLPLAFLVRIYTVQLPEALGWLTDVFP